MICKECERLNVEDLFQQAHNSPAHIILHSSYELLETAAKNGCDTCRTFYNHFNGNFKDLKKKLSELENDGSALPIVVFLQMAFSQQNGKRPIVKLHVQIGDQPDRPGVEQMKISFRVSLSWAASMVDIPLVGIYVLKVILGLEKETRQAAFELRYIEIDHDLGSDQNFGIAQGWIRNCCNDHDPAICPALRDVNLPTRLIYVGPPDNHDQLRLIQTSKTEKGRYLALSHCWGPPGTKKLLTTTETLESRLASIDQSEMPANFSDAVIITRRLGYRYLWIDSLCIIQDSKTDWETESQNMGNIYTNAAITLAAAAATSGEGGMLTKGYQPVSNDKLNPKNWFLTDSIGRSHVAFAQDNSQSGIAQAKSVLSSCRIKLNSDDEAQSIILDPLTEFSDLEENWFRCTVLGPLALRGWCLQEKLLSRQILYYGNRQIYWQCASARKAADGEDVPASAARSEANIGNEVSDWPDILSLRELHQQAVDSGSLEKREAVEIKIYKTWHNVLFLFINRRLTYDSDRLPGLAGMATLIHELTDDRYVAGFWLKYLPVSLLWTQTKSVLREDAPRFIADRYELEKPEWEKKDSKHTGPSWSWCSANINDVLDFWADHNEEYRTRFWRQQDVEIVDVNVDLVGENPFGQVKSGELVLKGYTYPRWDVRCLDQGPLGGLRVYSSLILGFCPHSPWNRDRGNDSGCEDRAVLWDYWPRQAMSPPVRTWKHILRWLVELFTLLLWQGLSGFSRERGRTDCGACNEYLCMHILSLVEKRAGKDGMYEADLYSLVLEPVPGDKEKYRRIGMARKGTYVTEDEFLASKTLDTNERRLPKIFSEWKCQEVVVI
ncbi:HET-domain-containing protein [Mollisia scopiformis]|uniref:HET-domain-containing protein n=1 Tax=Mollisia scopiformis TaxID=149040 RepID=A0A194XM15_MOLSC|nr:HET-domain-containing protein [Mollisia scopiformis]KUJ20807.1 HET-domain-containing protein [Mollisia scopiformis]